VHEIDPFDSSTINHIDEYSDVNTPFRQTTVKLGAPQLIADTTENPFIRLRTSRKKSRPCTGRPGRTLHH
jgi:hypothetical protein